MLRGARDITTELVFEKRSEGWFRSMNGKLAIHSSRLSIFSLLSQFLSLLFNNQQSVLSVI